MPCGYRIDLENRLVRCRAWGVITDAEVRATRRQFASDSSFSPDFSQLYDFSEVARIDITGDQIRDLGRCSPFSPDARRAAVAPQTVTYGLLRMFAIQHEAGGGQTDIQVFRSIGEAETWLGLHSATPKDI